MTRAPDATIMLFELDDHSFNEFKKWLSTNVGRLTNIGPYIWGISPAWATGDGWQISMHEVPNQNFPEEGWVASTPVKIQRRVQINDTDKAMLFMMRFA